MLYLIDLQHFLPESTELVSRHQTFFCLHIFLFCFCILWEKYNLLSQLFYLSNLQNRKTAPWLDSEVPTVPLKTGE